MVQLGGDVRQAGVLVCQLSRQHLQALRKHLLGILQLLDLPAFNDSHFRPGIICQAHHDVEAQL